ncbi:hypothetical protein [Henriciella aquimarina]|uniref:hypothetical protein n=1 Tax=Henriciella aquimarina TaxID=545261 RepID=UPI000A05D14A|nr:hypothetical protein [Henriciella aquimarina]
MWRSCLAGLFCLGLFACETAPPPAVELTPAQFDQAIDEAKAESHPWLTIQSLNETVETAALSDEQRARLLFERGTARRQARINLPGAVSDFRESLKLAPDSPVAANARTELGYADDAWGAAAGRLEGLQTLPEWFDDMVATGELEAAVERYRTSELAPTQEQAELLVAAGYLCREGDDDDWTLGQDNEHLEKLGWCENPGVS